MSDEDDDDFLPTNLVAKMFHVTKPTVRNWIASGVFPNAIKMGDGPKAQWFIPKSDIRAKAQKEYGS